VAAAQTLTPMKSRWILNLALVAIILALGAVLYFRPAIDSVEIAPPLTDLTPKTVNTIRIERLGRDPVVLEAVENQWFVRAPIAGRASPFNVDNMLLLATARSDFRVDATDLAKYGLDKPIARIWLNDREIDVGAEHPLQQQRYVRLGNHIYLLSLSMLSAAFFTPEQLLSTRLIEEGRKLVAIETPELALALKDGAWKIERSQRGKNAEALSTDRLNNLASDWEYINALTVARRSKTTALAQIKLNYRQNEQTGSLVLDVLSYEPDFVLARRDENLEYHFPQDTRKRLLTLEPVK
jgi:hypothetical protein